MENAALDTTEAQAEESLRARESEASKIVHHHAIAAAGLGFVPIPLLDTALIIGAQANMLRSLARLYMVPFSQQLGRSAIATLVGGSLPHTSGSLLKLIPGIGQLLGYIWIPAAASASTYALGRVFIQHFESGGTLLDFNPEKFRAYYSEQFESGQRRRDQHPPEPETKSAPKPEPKPAPKPAPKPEPTSAPKPEPTSAPKPEPTSAPKPEPTSAPKPAPKPEPKTDRTSPPPVSAAQDTGSSDWQAMLDELSLEISIAPGDATPEPAVPAGGVIIASIRFMGFIKGSQSDEFVEIKNTGGAPQDISKWRLRSEAAGQEFLFPSATVLAPGASVRVYTKLDTPPPGCFSFGSKRALWNDNGDTAYLHDAADRLVARYGYGDKETRTIESITSAFGVENLRVVFDEEQLAEQKKYRGKQDFLSALEEALRSLIEEPAGSAFRAATTIAADPLKGTPAESAPRAVQERVRSFLQTQKLILHSGELLPEGVSSVRDAWIFRLQPGMSARHLIIVSRSAAQAPYQKLS